MRHKQSDSVADAELKRRTMIYLGDIADEITLDDLDELARLTRRDLAIENWGDGETAWLYFMGASA